ncbi:hypothetical protein DRO91_03605 [Candidatus Heimdallarchaeota archaeon]|nr:MAG: hypothetical protein DRP02_06695 [Candidatus Gerdarchaeota archaeon]RLI73125.1 MAG: hypothetical protein DRO91_03605 [Candidatus Heimdallarchaeota archaeon]
MMKNPKQLLLVMLPFVIAGLFTTQVMLTKADILVVELNHKYSGLQVIDLKVEIRGLIEDEDYTVNLSLKTFTITDIYVILYEDEFVTEAKVFDSNSTLGEVFSFQANITGSYYMEVIDRLANGGYFDLLVIGLQGTPSLPGMTFKATLLVLATLTLSIVAFSKVKKRFLK